MTISLRCSMILLSVAVAILQPSRTADAMPLREAVRDEIAARLTQDALPPVIRLGVPLDLNADLLPLFYARRRYAPAWIDDFGLTADAHELLRAIRDSSSHGLCADDFRLSFIEPLVQLERDYRAYEILSDADYMAKLDLLLTDAFFRYALAMTGRHPSTSPGQSRNIGSERLAYALQGHLVQNRLDRLLAALEPQQEGYRRLQQALNDLRELSALGGWPPIPPGSSLREGDRGERARLLKIRLFLGGDLEDAAAWEEDGIGQLTKTGIRRFQERHGLVADGVAGPMTLAEMNVSVEERIRQVELNLLRRRQSPTEFAPRHIRVNIADFTLEVYDRGEIVMSMPVVVGTPFRETPTFSAKLSYLEFAPYWNVPATILREDKLPLMRRDPGWIERNHYEIVSGTDDTARHIDPFQLDWVDMTSQNFPGTLRMLPGPWNPLGQVKFMFPNRYAVYLHDTNEPHLFHREERLYSSGCIRIERPLDLVQYLLEGVGEWDCVRIIAALQGEQTLKVTLKKQIPVHLLYWTAWVDGHRRLQFRRDIYLRDADLEVAALGGREQESAPAEARLVRTSLSASERQQ